MKLAYDWIGSEFTDEPDADNPNLNDGIESTTHRFATEDELRSWVREKPERRAFRGQQARLPFASNS